MISASNLFGVMIVEIGIMYFLKSFNADFSINIPPVDDFITGSIQLEFLIFLIL